MATLRYEIDPHNRLIIKNSQKKTGVYRFRHVIDGRFKLGKANTLIYHIKAPSQGIANELSLPHQLKFKGNWSLTEDYNLKLTLNKWRRQKIGDEITLEGEIVKVDAHSLLFAVTQRTKEDTTSTYILKFEGTWQADANNRLVFKMQNERDGYDLLTFDGIWELNRRHQITYSYEKRLTGREKTKRRLLFSGFWNLTEKEVLTYQLSLQDKSGFDFRVGHGVIQNDRMKFELGIGVSRRRNPIKNTVILYGNWRIKKGTGLLFEIDYGNGRIAAIAFEAEAKLLDDYNIKFALRNARGRDLGMIFTLSRTLLRGYGESFIQFLASHREKAVYIGTGFMW